MLLSKEELNQRIELMKMFGVSSVHQEDFIDSANDEEFEGVIKLIDELSSAVWWLVADAGSQEAIKKNIERHLEVRRKLIEKIKEFGERRYGDDDFSMPAL